MISVIMIVIVVFIITVIIALVRCSKTDISQRGLSIRVHLSKISDTQISDQIYINNKGYNNVVIKSIYSTLLQRFLKDKCPLIIKPGETVHFNIIDCKSILYNKTINETVIVLSDKGEEISADDSLIIDQIIIFSEDDLPLEDTCTALDIIGPIYEAFSSFEQPVVDVPYRTQTEGAGILVDGRRFLVTTANIMMFNEDGSKDLTFATNGIFTIANPSLEIINYVLSDTNNCLYVCGFITGSDRFIEKLLPDGILDVSFSTTGRYVDPDATNDWKKGIIYPDGSSLNITGSAQLRKLLPNGTEDLTFGIGGLVTVQGPLNESFGVKDMDQFSPNGNIYVLGQYNVDPSNTIDRVIRLLSDGSIDPTYAVGGVFTQDSSNAPINFCNNQARRCFCFGLGPDESIYMNFIGWEPTSPSGCTGLATDPLSRFLSVLKLNSNGVIDVSFGVGGAYRDLLSRPIQSTSTLTQWTPVSTYVIPEDNSLVIVIQGNVDDVPGDIDFDILRLDSSGQLIGNDEARTIFSSGFQGQPSRIYNVVPTENGYFLFGASSPYALNNLLEGFFECGEICYPQINYTLLTRPW
jgi:hypothetical protein